MSGKVEYETRDLGSLIGIIGIVIIAVMTSTVAGTVWLVMRPLQPEESAPLSSPRGDEFAVDTFQSEVGSFPLQQLRQWEDEQLNQYGWISRDPEIVRIPIEQAMRLVAEEGLPVRDARRAPPGATRWADEGADPGSRNDADATDGGEAPNG